MFLQLNSYSTAAQNHHTFFSLNPWKMFWSLKFSRRIPQHNHLTKTFV